MQPASSSIPTPGASTTAACGERSEVCPTRLRHRAAGGRRAAGAGGGGGRVRAGRRRRRRRHPQRGRQRPRRRTSARARLGLLPLGTGNDFARSIGVPADLDGGARGAGGGRTAARRRRARRRSATPRRFHQRLGRRLQRRGQREDGRRGQGRWGPLSYLRAAVEAAAELAAFDTTLRLDGGETLERRRLQHGGGQRPLRRRRHPGRARRRVSTTACST